MNITLIEDTRQQAGKHKLKHEYFDKHGIKYVRNKLPVGDYALMKNMSTVIDTKKDIQEIIGDLTGSKKVKKKDENGENVFDENGNQIYVKKSNHENFLNQCKIAEENEINLIYLIENEDGIRCIDDLRNWENPRIDYYCFRLKKLIGIYGDYEASFLYNKAKLLKIKNVKKPPTSGIQLMNMLHSAEVRHGIKFLFCHPSETGKRIIEILTKENESNGI